MTTYFKKSVLAVLTLVTFIAFAHNSMAAQGDFSAGLKFGNMDVDGPAGSETAIGVQLGYRAAPRISAELEILQAEFGNVDVDTMGIYGTYRSAGDMYFLGKIGFATIDGGGDDESGLSYGIGGGIATGSNIAIEAEYTILDSDVSFFGITAKLTF